MERKVIAMKQLYTTKQVAEILQIPDWSLSKLIKSGVISHVRVNNSTKGVRISNQHLEDYLNFISDKKKHAEERKNRIYFYDQDGFEAGYWDYESLGVFARNHQEYLCQGICFDIENARKILLF